MDRRRRLPNAGFPASAENVLAGAGETAPAIFITGSDDPALRRKAERSGTAGFFSKPIPGRALIAAIQRATAST